MKTFNKICGFINAVSEGLKQWTKLGLLWLLLTFVLRVGFFFVMLFTGKVEFSSFLTVLSGVYFDLTVVLFTGVALLIPFLLIHRFLPRLNNVISLIFITLYVVVYGMLIVYFSNVGQPLDRVFFVYDIKEQINIIASSVRFSALPFIIVAVIVVLYVLLVRFWLKKVRVSKIFSIIALSLSLLFVVLFNFKSLITNDKWYKSYNDFFLASNQIAYTLNDFVEYWRMNSKMEDYFGYDEEVLQSALAYQSRFPEFDYLDPYYPFMRKSDDPDVLGPFMNATSDGKAPDFVFIIVESLGQRLSSTRPTLPITPFLDSLRTCSLYWPNCLALSERTFGALPNIFSSAPYDKSGFARIWFPIPDHNSILKDMSENGYDLSFYYGGNASFDGQDEYMLSNGVGYIMNPSESEFDQDVKEKMTKECSWGLYDKDMFNSAFRHRDTVETKRPNTDVYITLSTHEPFYFKGQDKYMRRLDSIIDASTSFGPREKANVEGNREIYSCFMYMDDCLKMVFDYYKSKPEFANTVFVITGDHRMGRVYVNASPLLKYNVPLIIYSPLQKEARTFKGVVTHHDIAPTITSYLSNNYDFVTDGYCHWIGKSLDVSPTFNCSQSVSFMRNNRDENEYLHNNYFLDRNRVFKVDEDLDVDEIDDDAIKDELLEYLRQYKQIDWYVTQNDYLLKKPVDVVGLYRSEGGTSPIRVKVGAFGHEKVFPTLEITKDFSRLYVDVEFDYKNLNNADLTKVSSEFKIMKNGHNLLYKAYRFSELSTDNGDGTKHFRARTTFFLAGTPVKGEKLDCFIFPQNEFEIEYKNINVTIEGLPLKK
ncbi:MAG: LTA synthase family protein [Candidatus Limimorpha sp.]